MSTRFFSLSEVTGRISSILQPHIGRPFWVKAEISSGRERGGSFYCDLVELDEAGKIIAKMSCTVWRRDLEAIRKKFREASLEFKLDDGTQVGLQCSVQYSPQYGLSLKVSDADPAFALGELELKRREILLRLEKEGLFEPNKRLPVPLLPQRIGLVTSRGSAAYNDFVQTLTRSDFGFTLLVADATMQGMQTEPSVIEALEALERLVPDLVVVARGGGSKTDLSFLDNELIARRIAACAVPVWTGIGHEIDTSVLDFVANRRFKTPTAVAEEIVSRYVEMDRHLQEARNRLRSTWVYRLDMEKKRLEKDRTGIRQGTRKLWDVTRAEFVERRHTFGTRVRGRLSEERVRLSVAQQQVVSGTRGFLRSARQSLDVIRDDIISGSERYVSISYKSLELFRGRFRRDRFMVVVNRERRELKAKGSLLRAADPENSLSRGFALVYGRKGRLVKSVKDVKTGETIRTRVRDGGIVSTVEKTEGKKDGKEG
jgi:exodeoxyribonuclease VII large subunit